MATNSLLEGKGGRTALVTTLGVVIAPGWAGMVDDYGNLVLEVS